MNLKVVGSLLIAVGAALVLFRFTPPGMIPIGVVSQPLVLDVFLIVGIFTLFFGVQLALKKTIIAKVISFLVIVFIVLLVSAKGILYYKTLNIFSNLNAGMLTGNIYYGGIVADLSGSMGARDVIVETDDGTTIFKVDSIVVKASSLLELAKLGLALAESSELNQLPDYDFVEKIAVEVKGLELNMNNEALSRLQVSDESWSSESLGGNCGNTKSIGSAELLEMGYKEQAVDLELVLSGNVYTNTFSYDVVAKQKGVFTTSYLLQLEGRPNFKTIFSNPQSGFKIDKVAFEYTDLSFNQSLISYCVKKSGLDRNEFIHSQVESMDKNLKLRGVSVSQDILEAYSYYLSDGTTLSIVAEPIDPIDLATLQTVNSYNYKDVLGLVVSIDDRNVNNLYVDINFEKLSKDPKELARERKRSENKVTAEKKKRIRKKFRPTAYEELDQYIGHKLYVVQSNGKKTQGRLLKVEENKLMVEVRLDSGVGAATVPIGKKNIEISAIYR